MRRSPLFHLAIGLLVVLVAFWAGAIRRWETSRSTRERTVTVTHDEPSICTVSANLGFIVKYKKKAQRNGVISRLVPFMYKEFEYKRLPGFSFISVERSEMGVENILATLRADPNVEYVEENQLLRIPEDTWSNSVESEPETGPTRPTPRGIQPNDPQFNEQWGLLNTGQPVAGGPNGKEGADIGAIGAWEITTGSEDVVIGVIDSGVDYRHPDLAANMWRNPDEIPDNGIDDDKNGVVDDVFGYNAANNSGDPMDDHSHGTHCAGIIGAVGDNGEGIAGVNWKTKIMALKFLSASGSGTLNDALECINYALEMKARGVNIRVLSNSWGGGGYSRALEDAIKDANEAGILFVAAAGNDGVDTDDDPHYPSAYDVPNVVSVAALDSQDSLAWFSNYGAETVDLAAPGVDIYSTVLDGRFQHYSGTSMATPYVSGAAGLILAKYPKLTPAELKARLMDSAVPVPDLEGRVETGGRLNAERALR